MTFPVHPERASLARTSALPSEPQAVADHDATSAAIPLSPTRRLALDADRIENRDVSLLLALALAESTRDLARSHREMSRELVEGRIALLAGMIRLEPRVAALLEDVRFLKTLATQGAGLAMAAAPAAKAGLKKVDVKLPDFGLKDTLQRMAARPDVANQLGRFQALHDRLVLDNPGARYVFAKNAAAAELGDRLKNQPALREAWLEVATKRHERSLVAEAKARQTRLDLADWPLSANGPDPKPVGVDALARDVFGPAPTRRQLLLMKEAADLLASGGDPFHAGLIRRTELLGREELAKRFEAHRPFYGRTSDAADRAAIAAAIRERRVDLSLPLRDADGTPGVVPGVKASALASTAMKQLDGMWSDGWSKEEEETPAALREISDAERAILDAWHGELMAARLDLLRWAGRFGDVFADVADITMGVSDG